MTEQKEEVFSSLCTMLEGDDMDFDGVDPDDPIWTAIDYPEETEDPETWVESLSEEQFNHVYKTLKDAGYL